MAAPLLSVSLERSLRLLHIWPRCCVLRSGPAWEVLDCETQDGDCSPPVPGHSVGVRRLARGLLLHLWTGTVEASLQPPVCVSLAHSIHTSR